MKLAFNIEDFYRLNDTDVTKILHSYYKNIMARHSEEDIKNEIYEKLIQKKYIEDYRPLKIYVDDNGKTWEFTAAEAKFSTYIFTFIRNYVLAYYGKKKHYENWDSLNEYNDSLYSNTGGRGLKVLSEDSIMNNPDMSFNIDMEKLSYSLEKISKHKGVMICDSDLELSIMKFIEEMGPLGCLESKLHSFILKHKHNKSKAERLEAQKIIEPLLTKQFIKIITKIKNNKQRNIYILHNPTRRNIYNLFMYYKNGFKDKEISEQFKMTVAGVGALKRSLRKELSGLSLAEDD